MCVACLGVLQELCDPAQATKACVHDGKQLASQLKTALSVFPLCRQLAAAVKAQQFEFDSLVLSVSLPAQLCVREVSLWLLQLNII